MSEKKQTVLLVEDEAPAALVLFAALESEGYMVLKATDGKEGLALALANHPDVILADLKMPKMGGMEMIHEIRQDSWGKKAEIIILTNVTDEKSLEEAMSEGTFHYMVKGDSSVADIVAKVRSRLSPTQ
ncbi:MAG: two-component system, chemotaxis family, sensor kinase CheA [Parcubacteria group bacterium Gr01-1014_8]|nr:MAG: two-component system, chemotaxis family, sensor kinase CheA [Parcubacteria group bacterium Gr01-1014_8]